MKTTVNKKQIDRLVRSHHRLQGMDYGDRRNAALEQVQRQLEQHGIYNRNGTLVVPPKATQLRGFQILSAGGVS